MDYNPFHRWSNKLLLSCGDSPPPLEKKPVKGLVQGDLTIPLGVGQLYP